MKRILLFVLIICSLSLVGCAKKEKLVIGLDENFPPMGFRDDKGELVGFDIDLAKEAGKRMGVELTFQPIDWGSKELELSSKKIDLLWNGVTITDERKQVMLFSDPYLYNRQIVLVKKDSGIKTKADLKDKIMGVQKASSAIDAMETDPETLKSFKSLQEYADNVSAFLDLEIGRIDAVVVDEIVARYYISQKKPDFDVLEENFGEEKMGIAMRLDDTALREKLQKALNEMYSDGTAAKISETWFNEDILIKN